MLGTQARKPRDILSKITMVVTVRQGESWGRWLLKKAIIRLLQNTRKKMVTAKAGEGVGGSDGSERWIFMQWSDDVRITSRWGARRGSHA